QRRGPGPHPVETALDGAADPAPGRRGELGLEPGLDLLEGPHEALPVVDVLGDTVAHTGRDLVHRHREHKLPLSQEVGQLVLVTELEHATAVGYECDRR